ncbi:MAG: PP2C family serine/threonine-protein phosphatase [Kofleriaceae bacterium]
MLRRFVYAVEVVGIRGAGQDRAAVFETNDGVVIVVADGAGGTGSGAVAAQGVVDAVRDAAANASGWSSLLLDLDRSSTRLGGGQTTAVIVSVTGTGIAGASGGDSGAWLIRGATVEDLTSGQMRKPLLGAGCMPRTFKAGPLASGVLLVATDGLLKYGKQADIARIAGSSELRSASPSLVDLVRLRSGALKDDVTIVLCREAA